MKRLALALTLVALSACSVLPKREPTTIYEPTASPAAASASWPQARWSLLVARPAAGQMLDSERINVRPSPGAVQVYKGASWADAAPNLLQTALLRSLEDSQKILTVSRPGGGVHGDYQLLTELRAFESVYVAPGQPQAVIEVYAKLIHTDSGEVVAARNFRETEASASEAIPTVVDALSHSLAKVSAQVAGWTLASGQQHASSEPSKKAAGH